MRRSRFAAHTHLPAAALALCAAAFCLGCATGEDPATFGGGPPAPPPPDPGSLSSDENAIPGGACPHTTDRFSFHIAGYGLHGLGCGAETGTLERNGVVTSVDNGSIELTTCPPNATGGASGPCSEVLTVYVTSADFAVPLILGAFVRIKATVSETAVGCAEAIQVENLPALAGVPNPYGSARMLWFGGADGTLDTSLDALYHAAEAQGCGAESRPGFADQQISFSFAQQAGAAPRTFVLPMGSSHVTTSPSGDLWMLRNLRSFRYDGAPQSDQSEFAYWIAYAAMPMP